MYNKVSGYIIPNKHLSEIWCKDIGRCGDVKSKEDDKAIIGNGLGGILRRGGGRGGGVVCG